MKFQPASAILRDTFNEECLLCLHNQHANGTLLADKENQWLVPSRLRPEMNNWKQPFSSSVSLLA